MKEMEQQQRKRKLKWRSQHFQLIAETIGGIEDPLWRARLCFLFVKRLREKNPEFDTERFLSVCGIPRSKYEKD